MKNSAGDSALNTKQFSDCDIFIGATALQSNAFICTTDGADFPRPLFQEIHIETLTKPMEKLYLLQPDIALFQSETSKFLTVKS